MLISCSLLPIYIWIWYVNVLVNSMHLNLVGRTTATHKGSKICGQTQFSSIATTASDTFSPPCTRSQTAVKSRMIRSMIGEQSGNLNTSKHLNKIPEHKVTDLLTAHWQMHARTHPTLLARHSHYGNERRTRRKMTVVVRPRGYTHMAKIDHFERLFRQLWTRVFAPNKLIWKARNELNPFLQKIAATYKLLKSPTFRPIFQIGPRTTTSSATARKLLDPARSAVAHMHQRVALRRRQYKVIFERNVTSNSRRSAAFSFWERPTSKWSDSHSTTEKPPKPWR